MSLELAPLCKSTTIVAPPLSVGAGAMGNRTIGELTSVEVEGDRLSGSLAGSAAADWMLVNGTIGNIDVRLTIRTPDDALIYMSYTGKLNLADFDGGFKVYVGATFETGDERYAWVNDIQAVGKGFLTPQEDGTSKISYEFFELK